MSASNTDINGTSNPELSLGSRASESESHERPLPVRIGAKRPLTPSYGNRPVEPSHLDLVESHGLPSNRPVSASNLKLTNTVSAYGVRPIAAGSIEVAETISLSGNRPVGAATLQVSEGGYLPGNRPIASNDLGEEANLMGYLD